MPPRPKKATEPAGEDPQVLDDCFPAGWPDGATAVACEHGSWTRPAAAVEATAES